MHSHLKYIKQIIISFIIFVVFSLNSCANKSEQILKNNKMEPIVAKAKNNNIEKIQENQFNNFNKNEQIIEIAALLPTSGEYALLGNQMFNLIKIGVEESGCMHNINYAIYDGIDQSSISQAVPNILKQNTNIVIGPMFSKLLHNLNVQINENIPVISFSNDKAVLAHKNNYHDDDNSNNVNTQNLYLFGHMPLIQSIKIVKFIINEQISSDIILLLPEPQNNNLINFLKENILKNSGNTLNVVTYNKEEESIAKAIKEIKSIAEKNNNNPNNLKKIGVYISDNKKGLDALLGQIQKYNLDKIVNIFGDNRLDSSLYHNINMYYTGSLNLSAKLSNIMMENEFNYMHKLAYDLGFMLGKIIQKIPNANKETVLNALENTNWFEGSSGYFKVQNNTTIRKYDVIRNINNKIIKMQSFK